MKFWFQDYVDVKLIIESEEVDFWRKNHETYNLILGETESRSSSESSEDEVDYPCEKSQCNVDIFYPKIIEIPYDP